MNNQVKFRRKWSFTGGQVKNSVILLEAAATAAAVLAVLFFLFEYRVQPAKKEYDTKISVNYVELVPGSENARHLAMIDPAATLDLANPAGFSAFLPGKINMYRESRPLPQLESVPEKSGQFVRFADMCEAKNINYLYASCVFATAPVAVKAADSAVVIGENGRIFASLPLASAAGEMPVRNGVVRVVRYGDICRWEVLISTGSTAFDRKIGEVVTGMEDADGIYTVMVPEKPGAVKVSAAAGDGKL